MIATVAAQTLAFGNVLASVSWNQAAMATNPPQAAFITVRYRPQPSSGY